ncbi:MAG: hypothetical protein Q7W56_08540 [Candidatus Latescibacteria bacterium]|nr:hypothetical protein [Candidatus Latescibacterota bacterium]
MKRMKSVALHLLLLLGCFQAVIAPAALPDDHDGRLLYQDRPYESLPTPAESSTALKLLTDAPRSSGLPGNWKILKGILVATPVVAIDGDPALSQIEAAGHACYKSLQLHPINPRAPPAVLPV